MIIWLASYPRSGNTFLRVILNTLFEAKSYSVYNDKADIGSDEKTSEVVGHKIFDDSFNHEKATADKEVYFVKTHDLPDERIAEADRVIYLIRDGRDSSCSLMTHQNNFGVRDTTLEDVINGNVFGGRWGEHVRAWSPKQRENCLLIKFEDLIMYTHTQVERLSDFIGIAPTKKKLPTFEELKEINPQFFSKGKMGTWKEVFTEESHLAFWLKNYQQMIDYGYIEDAPAAFIDETSIPLFRALSEENKYLLVQCLEGFKRLTKQGLNVRDDIYDEVARSHSWLRDYNLQDTGRINGVVDSLADLKKTMSDGGSLIKEFKAAKEAANESTSNILSAMDEIAEKIEKLDGYGSVAKKLKDDNEKLQAVLKEERMHHKDKLAEIATELENKREENIKLDKSVEKLTDENRAFHDQTEELTKKLARANNLDEKIEELKSIRNSVQAENTMLKNELESLQRRLRQAESRIQYFNEDANQKDKVIENLEQAVKHNQKWLAEEINRGNKVVKDLRATPTFKTGQVIMAPAHYAKRLYKWLRDENSGTQE